MKIAGATALVTGASNGLGAATARLLHDRGARVAALDLTTPASARNDDRWITLPVDVSSAESVDAAFAQVSAEWVAPSIVVHCAGIAGGFRLLGADGPVDPARFARVIDVNLRGTFHVLRAAAWAMSQGDDADTERGVIITTASIAALEGQQGQTAYSASKAGVLGMLLPSARELATLGIRCVTLAPGAFATGLTTGLPDSLQAQLVSSTVFPKRLGDPAEFAHMAAAVIENEMINAEVIRVDAGARLTSR